MQTLDKQLKSHLSIFFFHYKKIVCSFTLKAPGRGHPVRAARDCGRCTRLLPPDKGEQVGQEADMEELSAVGEQVFDAECILNKRLKKVRPGTGDRDRDRDRGWGGGRLLLVVVFSSSSSSNGRFPTSLVFVLFFLSGKVGVSGEVERLVVQVSTRKQQQPPRPPPCPPPTLFIYQ